MSTPAAIAMAVIQIIYQQVENYIVYPIVYRKAVSLSPFTTIVAVLIAGSILGVVGAILAVPFAAVIKILLHEAGAPRRAGWPPSARPSHRPAQSPSGSRRTSISSRPERLDLVQQALELGLVAQLAPHDRLGGLDRGGEALERIADPVAQPSLDPDLVSRCHHEARRSAAAG